MNIVSVCRALNSSLCLRTNSYAHVLRNGETIKQKCSWGEFGSEFVAFSLPQIPGTPSKAARRLNNSNLSDIDVALWALNQF